MCLAVYIASEFELPTEEWSMEKWSEDKLNRPYVFFEPLSKENELVTRNLSLPYIYHVGTNTGCSCGFIYSEWYLQDVEFSEEERKNIRIARGHYKLLHDMLSNLKRQDRVKYEIFVYWEGAQIDDTKTVQKISISLDDLVDEKFYFKEMHLYEVNT